MTGRLEGWMKFSLRVGTQLHHWYGLTHLDRPMFDTCVLVHDTNGFWEGLLSPCWLSFEKHNYAFRIWFFYHLDFTWIICLPFEATRYSPTLDMFFTLSFSLKKWQLGGRFITRPYYLILVHLDNKDHHKIIALDFLWGLYPAYARISFAISHCVRISGIIRSVLPVLSASKAISPFPPFCIINSKCKSRRDDAALVYVSFNSELRCLLVNFRCICAQKYQQPSPLRHSNLSPRQMWHSTSEGLAL